MLEPLILFENDEVLVLNKPSGLAMHGDGTREGRTVADWILEKYPVLHDVGEPIVQDDGVAIVRPGIVHRLDKETSGVLIIAKTQESFLFLKDQFKNREVKKTYSAFVYGIVKDDEGTIDFPIGRSRKDFRLRSAQPKAKGDLREAITKYHVVARGQGHTYLELYPKTGRTHQIRVHMKAIHHPVVCDRLYAPNHPCDLGLSRLALHASELSLVVSGDQKKTFQAPLPEEFRHALSLLKSE